MNEISTQIEIRPRTSDFKIGVSHRTYWHGGSAHRTLIYNAMSTLFPEGEYLFMDSVRAHRHLIRNSRLQDQVRQFLRQEAHHSREHVRYNEILDAQGFGASRLHELAGKRLGVVRTLGSRRMLACTCALEHFTATFGHELLSDPSYLLGADDSFSRVWTWHCIEEIEHKAVAFDVYQEVYSGFSGYVVRVRVMLLATIIFSSMIIDFTGQLMKDKGLHRSWRTWAGVLNYLFARPGLFRRMLPGLIVYMRPGFHPWGLDNRPLIEASERRLSRQVCRSDQSAPRETGDEEVPAQNT